MNTIIRYSFKEFQDNYETDYKIYLQIFPDASKSDFNYDLISTYKIAIENVEIIHVSEHNITDTKASFTCVNYIEEIKDNIKNPSTGKIDYQIARKFETSFNKILQYINELKSKEVQINSTDNTKKNKPKLSNPKKLALLQELGIFDLPIMKELADDKQNELVGLLLDADKTEFVYKNRLNLNSKNPNYQIDKYGSYKYLDEMKSLLNGMK